MYLEIFKMLIEGGIDVNATALHLLCWKYRERDLIEFIQMLLQNPEIDLNIPNKGGWSALLSLCKNYHHKNLIDIVKLFIERGVDINSKTRKKWNAINFLCRFYPNDNMFDIVKLLIDNRMDTSDMIISDLRAGLRCNEQFRGDKDEILGLIKIAQGHR